MTGMNQKFNNIESVRLYVNTAYNFFNGRINPTIKATSLKYKDPEYTIFQARKKGGYDFGSSYADSVIININTLWQLKNDIKNITDAQFKSVIIYTVLHELSHCNQEIDYLKIKSPDDIMYYELANDHNVFRYVLHEWPLITYYFGDLDQSAMVWASYIENDIDISKYQYIPTNKQEKAYKLIEFLSGKPIPKGLMNFYIVHIPDPNDPHKFDYKIVLQDGRFVLENFNLFTELCESNIPILTSDKLDSENKEYIVFIENAIQAHN